MLNPYNRSSQKRKKTSLTSHSPSKRLKTTSRDELILAMFPRKGKLVSPKSPWKLKLLSHTKVVSPQKMRVLSRRFSPRKDESPIPKTFKAAPPKKATSPQKLKVLSPSSSPQKNESSLPKVASPEKTGCTPQKHHRVYFWKSKSSIY